METIAQRHTQHNRTYTHSHQGHASLYPIHHRKRRKRPVGHWREQQEQRRLVLEEKRNQKNDEKKGYAHGHHKVRLDSAGIVRTHSRRAVHKDLNLRMTRLKCINFILYHIHEIGRSLRIHIIETRSHESENHITVLCEEMTVLECHTTFIS